MAKALSSTVGVMWVRVLLPSSLRRILGGGCLYLVSSMALLAAKCCAFLILNPSAEYSSSPSFSVTVKVLQCAGPRSPVSLYW